MGKPVMLLYYSYVILMLMIPIIYTKQNPCQSSQHCSCAIVDWVYRYDCKLNSSDHHINIVVTNFETAIDCHGYHSFETNYLPPVNYAYRTHTFKIYRCSVPVGGFRGLLEALKSNHLTTLFFERRSTNQTLTGEDFKGLENLDDLVLHENHLTTWNESTLKYLTKLKVLSLDFNNLELYDYMFQNATTVTYLSIQNNSLTYLPKKVFKGLVNVDRLHLENNQISNFDREIIEDLVNLKYLIIYNNRLHYIDENIFSAFPQLVWIFFNGNVLKNVSRVTFSYCRPEVIKLNNNLDLNVTDDVFSNFFTLIWAESMNIGLETISEKFYSNSVSLEYINLRKNRLKTLPQNVFRGLEHLKTLDLGENKIIKVKSDTFEPLKNLIVLYLDHNSLTTVSDKMFLMSSKLRTLDLEDNEINIFETNMVMESDNGLKQSNNSTLYVELNEVSLNNNKLVRFPENSVLLAYARSIYLDHNSIEYINTTSFHYLGKGIQNVTLEYNNISVINFENMKENYLGNNDLKINVHLSYNPINCDCRALDLVNYVHEKKHTIMNGLRFQYETLSCSNPSNLRNMTLKEVPQKDLTCRFQGSCTKNNICVCSYRSSDKTYIIECSSRYISEMPVLELEQSYKQYDEIDGIEVYLQDNLITQIPKKISGYSNVTKLYLQNNFIGNVSWIPPTVEVLDLGNNNLTTLGLEILKQLSSESKKEINLSNNPWKCSCQNLELSHLLKNRSLRVIDINNIRCNASGSSLISLNDEDLCPIEINLVFIVLPVCLIVSLITIVLVLLCYIYSELILAWLYSKGFCLWLVKEERIDKSKKYDAFISFASQDEHFVYNQLVPELERGTPSYDLCVHSRDWMPGLFINTQITDSVKYSRRTLVVLSKYFLESVWGRMEFRTAHTEAIKEGRVRVIVIIYGDVNMETLDDEMKTYIGTNTYIKWGDPWFWEKLKYALPRRHRKKDGNEKNKFELSRIESTPSNHLEMNAIGDSK